MTRSHSLYIPEKVIDVVEVGHKASGDHLQLDLSKDIKFSTTALESYAFARWEPLIYDAMIVAAVIEFGDRAVKRPPRGWARRISLSIPVHDPERWSTPEVLTSLVDTIEFLTGDYWEFSFVKRSSPAPAPSQEYLDLPVKSQAILAYSDGMDSRAVAGILGSTLRDGLVRVRVGSKTSDHFSSLDRRQPFTSVPYSITLNRAARETSARNRGFRFALISAIAAYLTGANDIVIPESGQGALGPALVTVGHAYPDYRNHPLFTTRMERFVRALLGHTVHYIFPRLWHTKGETLREFVELKGDSEWRSTRSCWRNSQWSSADGKLRQCGVCAACMLRRLSVHAAGLQESHDTYICVDVEAPTLTEAVDANFTKLNSSYEQYAIAGALHMDHMADMAEEDARSILMRHAALIAPLLGLTADDAYKRLQHLFGRHSIEWNNFVNSAGARSFIRQWVRAGS